MDDLPTTHVHPSLNLSLAMIQEDYGAYVAAAVGEKLLSGRFSHEAVNHGVRVEVKCGHRAVRSNAPPGGHARRARNVELNDDAVLIAHKAVIHICPVNVVSCDLPIRIDCPRVGTLERAGTRARSIECGDDAILIQQETVSQIVGVNVDSHDGSIRSKAHAIGTLCGPPARAWNIECGDEARLIPQEAVDRIGPVKVESCDLPTWADPEATRTLADSCAPTRRIERGDSAIAIPQETVIHESRVSVESRDRSVRVDEVRAETRKGALTGPRARARCIEDGNHALIGANVAVGRID